MFLCLFFCFCCCCCLFAPEALLAPLSPDHWWAAVRRIHLHNFVQEIFLCFIWWRYNCIKSSFPFWLDSKRIIYSNLRCPLLSYPNHLTAVNVQLASCPKCSAEIALLCPRVKRSSQPGPCQKLTLGFDSNCHCHHKPCFHPIKQARKLQATLVRVRNYDRPTHSLTGVRCRATSVAKKTFWNTFRAAGPSSQASLARETLVIGFQKKKIFFFFYKRIKFGQ